MTTTSLPTTANPAPLGLAGFALTTILLNIHNAGVYGISVMIMGMGIFYGGIAQIIAGIMEYRQGNTFGTVAFVSYGSFWLSLVCIWAMPSLGLPAADAVSMGWYLAVWGIFTGILFIGTLNGKTIGKLVFGSLTILFFLLALANFTGSHALHTFAGFEGIVCGALALYEAAALVINEKQGKRVLPL
jgi:succinate-acetate transporter protein